MTEETTTQNNEEEMEEKWKPTKVDGSPLGPEEEQVMEGLREVYDPEIGMSIIELGLVRKIILEPDRANIKMMLTTPFCPMAGVIVSSTQEKVEEVTGLPTEVDLLLDRWDPSFMESPYLF